MSLSCLLSHQRHCVSPLIEFWSYPLRCSCFSGSYLMSQLPLCLNVCLTLFRSASMCGWWFSLSYLSPFFLLDIMHGFQFLLSMWIWTFCASGFHFPAPLRLTFATHWWLLSRRSFLFPHFDLRVFSWSLTHIFSHVALSSQGSQEECTISFPANMHNKPIGQGVGFDFSPKSHWCILKHFIGCLCCLKWKVS